ncbi:MAG: tetratricopeptide repeat protein [Polyangiales bacterium]
MAVLARAYAATDDWSDTLGLVDHRLAATDDPDRRADVLMEAASLKERRADDPAGALAFAARALPEVAADPDRSAAVESELARLAARTGGWAEVVGAYRAAIDALGDAPRATPLAFRMGELLEREVGDAPSALAAFTRVAEADREDLDAASAVLRVAARTGEWPTLAAAFVATSLARAAVEPALVSAVESTIDDDFEGWSRALSALESAVGSSDAPASLARALETSIGVWHRDRRSDDEAAEARLRVAVSHDGGDAPTLSMLADLQRRAPGQSLIDTLRALGRVLDGADEGLDALHEAATVALDLSDDETSQTEDILKALLHQAEARWRALALDPDADVGALHHASERASWALRHLVDLYAEAGRADNAVRLLVAGANMPYAPDEARALRHEAAERAARDLGDADMATQLYRRILDETVDDFRAIAALAALYEAGGMRESLLALRRDELKLTEDLPRRVELRLEIARILEALGDADARVEVLRENLGEAPGHAASVDVLESVLSSRGDHRALLDLFEQQARAVALTGDADASSALWRRAAILAEEGLRDPAAAITAWEHVAADRDDAEALDHLARLNAARGDHASAARYLERRLAGAEGEARRDTVARLAEAQLAVGSPDAARATLERGVAADPGARALRAMLAEQYRAHEDWEPLAALLSPDDGSVEPSLAELREAAEVLHDRIRAPERAVPVLERAAGMAPDDRGVRAALADALRGAGRLEEARAMLDALVESYGRQRPLERAVVHYHLAQLAQARGDTDEALAQLETASTIDMAHPGIFKLLGDLSREAGQLQRAERAYRALLMIVRRNPPPGSGATIVPGRAPGPGPSEVLYELHRIAEALGDDERAKETLESAFETASRSGAEARRFERALRDAGEPRLLLRAMETRLSHEDDPAKAAEVLGAMAEHLRVNLDRPEEALEARLRAVARLPLDEATHEAAISEARALGRLDRYAEALGAVLARSRDAGDAAALSSVGLRLARLQEGEIGDLAAAARSYEAAEAGADEGALLEVWRGLDRAYRGLDDKAGQARVLRKLVDADPESPTENAWRLAELQLASGDDATRDEGVEWLAWAFEREPDQARAIPLLRAAAERNADESLLALFESVAREGDDVAVLLESLERRAALPTVSMEVLREAVSLAETRGEEARVDALLTRAVEAARDRGDLADAVWALVALAERRRVEGDLAAAGRHLSEAAAAADPIEGFALSLQLGALASGPLNDLELAARTYESLRERDPSDRAVWEPSSTCTAAWATPSASRASSTRPWAACTSPRRGSTCGSSARASSWRSPTASTTRRRRCWAPSTRTPTTPRPRRCSPTSTSAPGRPTRSPTSCGGSSTARATAPTRRRRATSACASRRWCLRRTASARSRCCARPSTWRTATARSCAGCASSSPTTTRPRSAPTRSRASCRWSRAARRRPSRWSSRGCATGSATSRGSSARSPWASGPTRATTRSAVTSRRATRRARTGRRSRGCASTTRGASPTRRRGPRACARRRRCGATSSQTRPARRRSWARRARPSPKTWGSWPSTRGRCRRRVRPRLRRRR